MNDISPHIQGALAHLQTQLGAQIPPSQVEQLLADEGARAQLDLIGQDLRDDNAVNGVGRDASRQLLALLQGTPGAVAAPAPPAPDGQAGPARAAGPGPAPGPGQPQAADDSSDMFDGLRNFAAENPGLAGGVLGAVFGALATFFTGGAALPFMLAGGAALGFGAGKFGLLDGLFGREQAQAQPPPNPNAPPPEANPHGLPHGEPSLVS